MKKRALSMLLALALCFTVFSGIGSAAPITVDRVQNAVSNILDNVAQDADAPEGQTKRIDVIREAAANDATNADISAEPWAALATALLKDEAIDDTADETPVIYPYFLMRYIADPENAVDLTDKENVQAAIDAVAQADADINTANQGINASVAMFDDYQTRLTEIVSGIFDPDTNPDVVAELVELGFLSEDGEFTNKDAVIAYAKTQVFKAVQYISDLVFATSGEEFIATYNAFLADDITKKNAALVVGQELLDKLVTASSRQALTAYFRENKTYFKSEIIDEYLSAVFSADSAAAVAAVQEAAAQVAAKIEEDAANYTELEEIAALLSDGLGLTFTDISEALTDTINALDTESKDLQAVWFDLALNRALDVYNLGLSDKIDTVADGQPVSLAVYREGLRTRFDIQNAIDVSDKVYVVSGTEGVTVTFDAGMNAWTVEYDAADLPAETAKLHVYRGADAEGADVDRYIETFTVQLQAEEVPPTEKSITVEAIGGSYAVGRELTIKGTSENIENVAIVITDAEGNEIDSMVVTADEFAAGVSYTITDAYTAGQTYTVTVGEADAEGNIVAGVTATTTFTVVAEGEEQFIQIDESVLQKEYNRGDSVTIKGTSAGFEGIVVTIIRPDGGAYVFETITPEQFANEGVVYGIADDAALNEDFTIIVGGANGAANTDTYTFQVVAAETERTITIEDLSGWQYMAGDTVVIKGTSTGLENIVITVTYEDGTVVDHVTITADEYAAGYELTIGEDFENGRYDVVAGENDVTASTYFLVGDENKGVVLDPVNAEYLPGSTVTIKGTSAGFEALVVTVIMPDGTAYYYATVTPEELAAGIEIGIAEDAVVGDIYTIMVGESGEFNDSVTFTIADSSAVIELVREGDIDSSVTISRNTPWETVVERLPQTITLYNEDGTVEIDVPITWNSEDYDASASGSQTINGTYVVPTGYVAGGDVDGQVSIVVRRSGGGGGGTGGGTYKSITLDRSVINADYSAGESIVIKGTTTGYGTGTITITVTAPDGTVRTVEITPDQFSEGYNLNLAQLGFTQAGEYTIDVDGQRFTINYSGINSDIFNKEDHMAYIIGYEDGTVRPEANISREEVTTILYRLLRDDVRESFDTESTSAFSDVEADRWSMNFIATLDNMGILNGYEDGTFMPGRDITRAEFAALCSRLVSIESASIIESDYSDVEGHWAENSIYVVTAEGWFQGDEEGTFRPDDSITRAEAITVINRILERDNVTAESFEGFEIVEFSDLSADAWYYPEVVEATNAHDYEKDETTEAETWVTEAAETETTTEAE